MLKVCKFGGTSLADGGQLKKVCDIVLADHPDWGAVGVRFDILLVDAQGRVRRISDAFRQED